MKLDNRWAAIFIGVTCLATTTGAGGAGRPNIVCLIADDHTSHVNGVNTLRESLGSSADNVAKRLQRTGYQTPLFGKWHLKTPPTGLDYWSMMQGPFSIGFSRFAGSWWSLLYHKKRMC